MIIPNCLTPGEADIFSLPNVQEAINALYLVPIPSQSFKINLAVNDRITTWLSDFAQRPYKPVSTTRTIQDMWFTPIVDPGAFNEAKCPF